jgi:hypothetical protein
VGIKSCGSLEKPPVAPVIAAGGAMEQQNAGTGTVKRVYSFIVSTIMVDSSSQMGMAMLKQIPPYVYQSLNGTDPTFKKLYDIVQKEDSPHMLGTGMAHSPDDYAAAFLAWLKTKGVNIINTAPLMKKQIFLFAGDAMNPQTNKSFNWCMFIYFDIG